jgi:TolB-like protein
MKRLIALSITLFIFSAFGADTWVTTGKDIAFPQELYFVGVGMSERSQDIAKQNAMVEVRKQITVSVSASMLDEQVSVIAAGKETSASRVQSRARLATSGEVQGIEVAKTLQQNKIYYALAVLDKKNFESNCRAKIAELRQELTKLVEGARADIEAVKLGTALIKLSSAKRVIGQFLDERKLLSAAATLTDAEKLPYTQTDIALLYDKCVSSLKMTKSGGDGQVFAVGMVPSDPFGVTITADGTPAPNIPVNLLDDKGKTVVTKYTDDAGTAQILLGELADVSAGSHTYIAAIALPVSSELKALLKAQNQTFSYNVTSNPCFTKISVEVGQNLTTGAADITKKVITRLSKFDIKEDPNADATLFVTVTAVETGNVQGLSENNTFVKTDVTLALALKDDDGKELGAINGIGKGTGGSLVKSAAQGVDNVKIEKDLKSLLEKICAGSSSAGKPKLRIAVFEFKQRNSGYYGYWYDLATSLSDMIITRLINTGKVDVVERSQLQHIMEEKSLGQSGVVEEKEEMQAAQLAGADLVLVGSAGIAGEKIEADARVVDLKSGIARCAMNSAAYAVSDLRAISDDLVGQIKGKCLK